MTPTASQIETSDPAELAAVIHNDVLQSLGVAVLGVDLCQRFHQQMRYEQALEEIVGIAEALSLALASSEQLLPALNQLLPASRPSAARPSLVVLDGAPGVGALRMPAVGRPAAGPREIVDTLTACENQARRCRGQYDAGLGEETMRDLELMLQRLEFASVTFREVMGQLRQLAGRPLLPQSAPERPAIVAFSRSA
jgi:hypothetical protein